MAQAPSDEEVKKAQEAAQKKIEKKIESQQAQGKDFVIDPEGHAAGVIPEKTWKGIKNS
jgi:hypothetical protein